MNEIQKTTKEMMKADDSFNQSINNYMRLYQMAEKLSSSNLVPKQFKNNPSDTMLALDCALRMGANPLMVFQNMYIVYGVPSWSSKFLISTFNTCGRFTAIKYEFKGKTGTDEYGCRATTVEKSTGEIINGPFVSIGMAKTEGWYGKQGSKWQTMPDLMLRYRSATFLIRTTAPEIGMGLYTAEEMEDVNNNKKSNANNSTTKVINENINTVEETINSELKAIENNKPEILEFPAPPAPEKTTAPKTNKMNMENLPF